LEALNAAVGQAGPIKERLEEEIVNLTRRANLNVVIGILVTLVAGIGLVAAVFYHPLDLETASAHGDSWRVIAHYVPRLSLIIFAEVFAYFFLKLYRTSLADIKYFQNEISNIDLKGIVRLTTKNVISAGHAAYFRDERLRLPLSSPSLPTRNHQSLRLVIFPILLEFSRC